MPDFQRKVCVVGGGGHVGLPLALTFADSGYRTVIYDINAPTVAKIRAGIMPFSEEGGEALLQRVLATGLLETRETPELLSECEFIVLVIGTPIDEHLNPSFHAIHKAIDACRDQLRDGQTLILRSTIFPGISRHVQEHLHRLDKKVSVAFCPERVAQGYSLREIRELPQIISAFDPATLAKVRSLFSRFTSEMIEMPPMEAELCKLMTNAWRYAQFAVVNQFYMIATENGVNFDAILHGCRYHYPRMSGMPGPGFAAGPCLVKDTMQLAAYSQNTFVLGHAAMMINETLPAHLIKLAKRRRNLRDFNVGILGMAFKAESDDKRDSLCYKLRKLLTLEARQVLCTDPFVQDASLVSLERVIEESDVLFVGTPHKCYRQLQIPEEKLVLDVWSCLPKSTQTVELDRELARAFGS